MVNSRVRELSYVANVLPSDQVPRNGGVPLKFAWTVALLHARPTSDTFADGGCAVQDCRGRTRRVECDSTAQLFARATVTPTCSSVMRSSGGAPSTDTQSQTPE